MATFLARKAEVLRNIDPDRIYVENIRSFFNMPSKFAKVLCEMAVKDHFFTKKYGVRCPQCNRIIESYLDKSDIPAIILCEICEIDDQPKYEFKKDEVEIMEYYSLSRYAN